ncbi:MAG: class I SAM-dependent methyltransferase [Pseudomonadales bacterium]|jgi:SAM-dependent methyltransferase
MVELNIPRAHSNSWYDHLSGIQSGYYYPWQSTIGKTNGEDVFMDHIQELMTPNTSVLEVGCGHGELALRMASRCGQIIAYDRVQAYIDLAQIEVNEQSISNLEFKCHDAMEVRNNDIVLPIEDDSIDLIICRRGPLHWIEDAHRVCRNGATIVALSPMEEPIPAWSSKLPHRLHYENSGRHTGSGSIHQSVENRLHQAGLMLQSGWSFDVPEIFDDPMELYKMVTWGLPVEGIPSFADLAYKFDAIYEKFAEPDGIVLRHCRFLWQAIIRK